MNRREFLSGVRAAPAAGRTHALSGSRRASPFSSPPDLGRYDGPWDEITVAHLLRRTLIAPSRGDMKQAMAMSMDDLIASLIRQDDAAPPPPEYVGWWMDNPDTYFDSDKVWMLATFYTELRRWWCSLMIQGPLSVRERMTLFWHNHFSGDATTCNEPRYMYLQNCLYRRHALGNFKKLVREISIDKAMMIFLDGKQNKKGKEINENYARELQELFTIGVSDNAGHANYTQEDVYEAARVLTGWGWWGPGITGDISCPPWFGHDPTDKVVYGKTIRGKEHGEEELDDLLDIIFEREETPRSIVRKLYRFFVYTDAPLTPFTPIADDIENTIIIPLAEELRARNWDIAHVLRRLFSSRHFYDPEVIGTCIKSPVDLLVGTARALSRPGKEETEFLTEAINIQTKNLGQWLLVPPGVQGWQFYRAWISSTTLPLRHASTDELIDGTAASYLRITGHLEHQPDSIQGTAQLDIIGYARQFPSFRGDVRTFVDEVTRHLLAYPASVKLKEELRDTLLQGTPDYEWSILPAAVREERLAGMMKYLMRSAHYQLM